MNKLVLAAALGLVAFACEKPAAPAPEGGTRHQPPIAVAEVPLDHWYCDMGSVEYSRPDEGDGRCPICGMDLVHKTRPDQETAHPTLLKKTPAAEGRGPTR